MKPHDERPLVYIAGPYAHPDPVENTHTAIKVADAIQSTGNITAFVPHLTLLWHMVVPHDENHWYDFDLAFLARCDALLRIPGASKGADNEVLYAEKAAIPVFYSSEDLLTWVNDGPSV